MNGFRRSQGLALAAFAQMHQLLPGTAGRNYESFLSIMEKAKISKIAFLRHGKTAPSTGVDFDRFLTDQGREQARKAGLGFGRDLNPFFSPVLVSPAPRTVETAKIFLAAANQNVNVTLEPIMSLYDGTMQPKGSALFKKIGYSPLRDYLTNENEQERIDAQIVLGAYAHSVVESMMNCVEKASSSQLSSTLWMVGHAIYLPAAALGVASLAGCNDQEAILSTNTKEAEGYLVDLSSNTIRYLSG